MDDVSDDRPVRVLVADDQKVVRDGLRLMLDLLPGIEVVGLAVDGDDAVRQATVLVPDVVLMDLNMPRCDGVEATTRLRRVAPSVRVVVLTTYSDDESVFGALRAGALGFLTKAAGADEIRQAVLTVAGGQAQLDPVVQRRLLEALAGGERVGVAQHSAGRDGAGSGAGLPDHLTAREAEVLRLIAQGLSNHEIATALVVSPATVKTHVNHLLAKTTMRDRAQLVSYAYRNGLAG